MNAQLRKDIQDVRARAATLLLRTEVLLKELREINNITITSEVDDQIPKKHGRIILHVR